MSAHRGPQSYKIAKIYRVSQKIFAKIYIVSQTRVSDEFFPRIGLLYRVSQKIFAKIYRVSQKIFAMILYRVSQKMFC